jgi:hypothetical protein
MNLRVYATAMFINTKHKKVSYRICVYIYDLSATKFHIPSLRVYQFSLSKS